MSMNSPQDNRLTVKSLLLGVLALLLLAGIAWALIFLFVRLLGMFAGIDQNLVAAATTVIVAVFTIMAGRYFERRKEIEAAYRDKKTAIYEEFLVGLFEILLESTQGEASPNQEPDPNTVKFLREHHRKLILWSGPTSLKAYSDWYRTLLLAPTSAQTVLKMEKFFLAFRTDLGHSNRGLKDGDVLRLMVNDIDLLLLTSKNKPDVTLQELSALRDQLTKSVE